MQPLAVDHGVELVHLRQIRNVSPIARKRPSPRGPFSVGVDITVTDHLEFDGIRPGTGVAALSFDDPLMETVIRLFTAGCTYTTPVPTKPY